MNTTMTIPQAGARTPRRRVPTGPRAQRCRPSRGFTDVTVWQKAHLLVLKIYRASSLFPRSEAFGITSRLRRAAILVPAGFAEAFRTQGLKEKIGFLNRALSALEECRYYLILARDLGYPHEPSSMELLEEVSTTLEGYRRAIERLLIQRL